MTGPKHIEKGSKSSMIVWRVVGRRPQYLTFVLTTAVALLSHSNARRALAACDDKLFFFITSCLVHSGGVGRLHRETTTWQVLFGIH